MKHLKLGELLMQRGLITQEQLDEAIAIQKKERGRIGEILVKMGIFSEEDIVRALGTQLKIPYSTREKNLLHPSYDQKLEKIISHDFAKTNLVLPLSRRGSVLTCAVSDPLDLLMMDNLKMVTGCEISPVIASRNDLIAAIQHFYTIARSQAVHENTGDAGESADGGFVESDASAIPQDESSLREAQASSTAADEAPVIKLVDLIIRQAIEQRVSDIHIEPFKDKVSLRYRIDGVLYQIPPPSKAMILAIISRLKILARLDIAEKRLPQDGSISFKMDDRQVDIRISTILTVWGEKVVMRILDREAVKLELAALGFASGQFEQITQVLRKTCGLFLVTGPTGSGKSTTLYSVLSETIDPRKNVMTAEDPVEFKLDGINQVQIKPDIGLTFASALRSFLRQDPDVIMVGEIRDLETAQICIRAALTGHFVLSSMHTNDSASAVSRLLDIGVDAYLITPSITCILAQRLARRLCPKCKEAIEPKPDLFGGVQFKSDLIFKAAGCEDCNHIGYKGRIVISETMLITDEIRELISQRASYSAILTAARKNGMDTLFEDGIKKVEAGLTSFDEVVSVTSA